MANELHVEDAKGNSFKLLEIDGISFPKYFTDDPEQRLKDIKEMKGRDDDVIIVAYPKAGNFLGSLQGKECCWVDPKLGLWMGGP